MKSLFLLSIILFSSCSMSYQTVSKFEDGSSSLKLNFTNEGYLKLYIDGNEVDTPSRKITSINVDGITAGKKEIFFSIKNALHGSFSKKDTLEFLPNKTTAIVFDNYEKPEINALSIVLGLSAAIALNYFYFK